MSVDDLWRAISVGLYGTDDEWERLQRGRVWFGLDLRDSQCAETFLERGRVFNKERSFLGERSAVQRAKLLLNEGRADEALPILRGLTAEIEESGTFIMASFYLCCQGRQAVYK